MQNHVFCRVSSCLFALLSVAITSAVMAQEAKKSEEVSKPAAVEDWRSKQSPLLQKLNIDEAWAITKGDPKVVIGVIDNGFDYFHPDLKGQLAPGYYYPGGFHGETYMEIAHGTLVCGLMVAQEGRPGSVTGLAPGCRVLTAAQGLIEHAMYKRQTEFFKAHPKAKLAELQAEMSRNSEESLKFAREWITFQVEGAAEAIHYLVDHGAKVINISGAVCRHLVEPISAASWGKAEEAFAYAANKDVLIVLAAGNNSDRWEDYPGTAETVIVAGGSKLDDTRWKQEDEFLGTRIKQGSNYGKRLTAMAPVQDLVICTPHEQRSYTADDGPLGPSKVEFKGAHDVMAIGATSSAAPIVSSLAALVRSARPDLDVRTVITIIERGCDDIGEAGFDDETGHGRVNFGKTLKLAREWAKPKP